MWRHTPEQRVWLAEQRQSELFRESGQWNLIYRASRVRSDRLSTRLLAEYGRRSAGLVAFVRRTLVRSDAPCNAPCPDIS